MSLALSTLIFEWRRYMAAVVALAFSGLLVLSQVGMFMGIGKAFTATIDRSRADIMVLGPKAEGLQGNAGVPRRIMPALYMNPEVIEVADLDTGGGRFQNIPGPGEKKKQQFVQLFSVDPVPGAVTLPTDYSEEVRQALLEPYAIAVDETALKTLGVKVGDKASFNGRTVKVAAALTGYPNLMQPQLVGSRDTLRLLGQAATGERVGPLFVRVRTPERAEQTAAELNSVAEGRYRAWTRAELAASNERSMMREQFIGILLGFSVFLGLLIGLGITSQTLRGALLANIKEFASFRALGVSMGSLRLIVLELSFWVGLAGLGATAVLVAVTTQLAKGAGLTLAFPPTMVAFTAVFLLAIAMVSGMMALGVLKKSQPADLLR